MTTKKKKLSVLSDRDEEALKKLSKKERVKAVTGNPDESDIRNLTELFSLYEKSHPGRLARMKRDYDLQNSLNEKVKTPTVKGIKSAELTMLFWMPRDLQEFLEPYYPTLWSNKSHAEWFVSKFPIFKA